MSLSPGRLHSQYSLSISPKTSLHPPQAAQAVVSTGLTQTNTAQCCKSSIYISFSIHKLGPPSI